MRALALTDVHSLAGIPTFWTECQKRKLKPIIGAEVNVWPTGTPATDDEHHRLIFLVESEAGYINLVHIITLANQNRDGDLPGIHYEDLREHTDGLLVIVGGRKSWLRYLLIHNMRDRADNYLNYLVLDGSRALFTEDQVIFALEPEGGDMDMGVISRLFRAAKLGSFLCVAMSPVRCLSREDSICCDFIDKAKAPKSFDIQNIRLSSPYHMMTAIEMRAMLDEEMHITIQNTYSLVDRCSRFKPDFQSLRSPEQDFIRGMSAETYLCDKTFKCALSRLNVKQLNDEIRDRLEEEFNYIMNNNWANNMLLLYEIARYCREQNFVMGIGRGNMLSCLVAYILGITQINPLEYHFKFLGFKEESGDNEQQALYCLPVEVPRHFSPLLSQFLSYHFGNEHAIIMGHYEPMQPHVILRHLMRWINVSKDDSSELMTAVLNEDVTSMHGISVSGCFGDKTKVDLASKEFLCFALNRLSGLLKNIVPESGQFAVSADNITRFVPVVNTTGTNISQYDGNALDAFNIPRLLIANNNMLDLLDMAIRCVRDQEHPRFDPEKLPPDDEDTFTLICRADTFGVELLEKLSIRSLLREKSPHNFSALFKLLSSEEATKAGVKGDICQRLPDTLLAYRLMFVKAHYSRAFFAALLSHLLGQKHRFSLALRELEGKRLTLVPPDIHLSNYYFDVKPSGIQVGLMAVSGMDPHIYEIIDHVRKNGEFVGIIDFCNRLLSENEQFPYMDVDIDRDLVENLIEAGAMDSFKYSRPQMIWLLEQWCNGQWRDSVAECAQTSSSHLKKQGYQPIEVPEQDDWSDSEKIRREEKILGWTPKYNLFRNWNKTLRICRCISVSSVNNRRLHDTMCFAGLIAASIDTGHRLNDDKNVVLDMEGRALLCDEAAAKRALEPQFESIPVVAVATIERSNNELYLKGELVWPVTVAKQFIDTAEMLRLKTDGFTVRRWWRVYRLLAGEPGKTRVEIVMDHDTIMSRFFNWLLSGKKINMTPNLYCELRALLSDEPIRLVLNEPLPSGFRDDITCDTAIAEF